MAPWRCRYLSFLRGLVDSDTLPLSVSREMLQQHASLKTIKKKMVRKALDLIREMSEAEVKCQQQKKRKEDGEEEEEEDEQPIDEKKCKMYSEFWQE